MMCFYLMICWFFFLPIHAKPLDVRVSAKGAIVMNADTEAILFEKNAKTPFYPASITKIATCLYALEKQENLDEKVHCPISCLRFIKSSVKQARNYRDPPYWLEPDGTHFWIKQGEIISFRDLLFGLMLSSGNDAANVIAHHIGGTIPNFVDNLNQYLKDLGCLDTHFSNPHGLHHPNHITTAYDMALITKKALNHPLIKFITTAHEYERPPTNLQGTKHVKQKNLLLCPGEFFYSRAIGIKIGYTSKAGRTFAAAATHEGRTLIVILLGCPTVADRYRDAIRLFEAAFAEHKQKRLLFKKEDNLFTRQIKGAQTPLSASLKDDVFISYFPAEEPKMTIELNWEALNLPIQIDDWVGDIEILDEKKRILTQAPLYATQRVKSYLILLPFWKGFVLLLLLGGVIGYYVFSRSRR